MSQENVKLVASLHPAPGTDMTQHFRDDLRWARVSEALAPALAADFKCTAHGYLDVEGEIFDGLQGLRDVWLQWLAPWQSYRAEVEQLIDLDDNVLVLVRDFARRLGEGGEVETRSAAVWTVRDGKVSQIAFCADRAFALKMVGLEE